MMKKQLVILAIFIIGVQTTGFCQSDSYKEKLRTMLKLNGSDETFKTVVDQMILQFQQMNSGVPQEFWEEAKKEFLNTSIDDLVTLLVPVYHRHLTEKDIDGIIVFYNTPLGKKFAEKTPIITQESMVAGQQWGLQISQKITEKMQQQGY